MHDGKLSRWHGIRSYVARVPTSLRALRSSFSNLLQTGRVPPTPDPIDAWEAQRGENLEYHRAQEKEQNREGRLPAGESVRLPAIWVAEVYLASHIPQLIDGLEGLGWVAEWDMGTPHGLADWIQNARRRGKGAAHHTGPWVSSDRKPLMRRLGFDFSAELPEAVRAMNPQVFQPAPSYLVIVAVFVLEESVGEKLTAVLKADYEAEVESMGAGWTVTDPTERRTIEANRVRSSVLSDCCSFMTRHLPGFYASRGPVEGSFPSADLILLDETPLAVEEERPRNSFLESLGISGRWLDYVGVHEGLLLRMPESGPSERGLTFAACQQELLPSDDLENYGGRSPEGFVHRLHGLTELVGLWALTMLIADLDADLAEVRDLLGAEAGRSDEGQHGRIRDFQRSVAVLMSDYLFSLRDWQSESGLKYLLGDAAVFTPREPRRLRAESLSKAMAESINADAARILDSIEILRDALQVQTALAAARSNERVAETNLTLQVVTIALAALALIAAIVSLSRTP
jgi:hypothetical protein